MRFRRRRTKKIRRPKSNRWMISSPNFRTPRYASTSTSFTYQTYFQMKNYPKTIEYADKLVAMGDKADAGVVLQALQTRVQAFSAMTPPPTDADQLTKERDAALQGAKLLEAFPKPAAAKMSDDDFAKQKKPGIAFFDSSAGAAALQMKDYPGAVAAFKAALAAKPDDAVSAYRLGLAYLAMNPPQALDGFWALARAVNLKVPDSDKVKDYLRGEGPRLRAARLRYASRRAGERDAAARSQFTRSSGDLHDSQRRRSQ